MFVIKTECDGTGFRATDGIEVRFYPNYDHDYAAHLFKRDVKGSNLSKVGGVLTDVGIQWHVFDHEP